MMNLPRKISPIGLVIGLLFGINTSVEAITPKINSLTEFYDYYDPNSNIFTAEQQNIIQGIFQNIDPYLGENGLDNAIAAGYLPLTRPWFNHGIHWFNRDLVDITNIEADPLLPSGLNVDKNGDVVGVFWTQELYQPSLVPFVQSLDLANTNPQSLIQLYSQYQQQNVAPVPTIFDIFGNQASWHTHKNVVIENLGARNSQGQLDPNQVRFRQSLSNENLINELLMSLNSDEIVLSPFEFDPSLNPPFNRGISPGFYMLHMWVGQGNEAGLFAGINRDIAVPENAIYEAQTFEDGSAGHDHDGEGSQSIPEPSSMLSLLGLLCFPIVRWLKALN